MRQIPCVAVMNTGVSAVFLFYDGTETGPGGQENGWGTARQSASVPCGYLKTLSLRKRPLLPAAAVKLWGRRKEVVV